MKTRKGKGNNSVTEMRSLHIKLSADHPIFLYEDGERSKVAREWMNRGMEIQSALREIKEEIKVLSKAFTNGRDSKSIQEITNGGTKTKVDPDLFLGL